MFGLSAKDATARQLDEEARGHPNGVGCRACRRPRSHGGSVVGSLRGGRQRNFEEVQLIRDISRYNEVDCKVMMELISYLRNHY